MVEAPLSKDSSNGIRMPATCPGSRLILAIDTGQMEQLRKTHGIISCCCPGSTTLITPAHAHIRVEVLLSAGILAMGTVGDPGTQGEAVTGMQGTGVKTPIAAEVAAATAGLLGVVHMPKGMMLVIGI